MKYLYGKPAAEKILEAVKAEVEKLGYSPVLKVVCEDKEQPYYKGIVKDAEYCGITVVDNGRDYDGMISLNELYTPRPSVNMDGGETIPCTAEAVMELLKFYNVPVSGKNVCIIGRSDRVGRPLSRLMLDADATVTTCHSKTANLQWNMLCKDIIVSCVGKLGIDGRSVFNQYLTIVDVGGDFRGVNGCNGYAPPVGGVGPVTRAVLMRHVTDRAKKNGF